MAPRGSAAPDSALPAPRGCRRPSRGRAQLWDSRTGHCARAPTCSLHPASSRCSVSQAGPFLGAPQTPQTRPHPLWCRRRRPAVVGPSHPQAQGIARGGWPGQHPGEERPWPRLSPGSGICPAGPGQGKGPAGLGERSASAGTGSPAPCHGGGGGHGAVPSAGRVPRAARWLAAAAMRLIASN